MISSTMLLIHTLHLHNSTSLIKWVIIARPLTTVHYPSAAESRVVIMWRASEWTNLFWHYEFWHASLHNAKLLNPAEFVYVLFIFSPNQFCKNLSSHYLPTAFPLLYACACSHTLLSPLSPFHCVSSCLNLLSPLHSLQSLCGATEVNVPNCPI